MDMGRLYSDLFDSRQKGDYGDMYDFDKETVESLLIPVKDFIDNIKQLLWGFFPQAIKTKSIKAF